MTERMDDELLARYLADQAGADDEARVRAWAARTPENARELERLSVAWGQRPAAGSWNVDAAWERVHARLDEPTVTHIGAGRRPWIRYVAAAAVLLLAAGILTRVDRTPTAFETGIGERQQVDLPDGSRVVLAPDSRLALRRGFGQAAREVELRGRAWFEVRHDSTRAFRVVSGGMLVEVLGTEFEVKGARDDAPLQVTVMSGAVAVREMGDAPDRAIRLGPRDVARVASGVAPTVRHEAPVETLVAWRAGTLGFDDTPVREILSELSRWYGVAFRMADSGLGARRFSGTFRAEDLADALETLSTGLGVRAARDGDVVTFSAESPR